MAVNQVTNQATIQEIIDKTSTSASSRKTGELGKDDFLNLMVTQLRYQDPLNPTDDKEFIGQMAQFSSLEQMQNMNSSFSASKAFSLIGKHVLASITDEVTKEVKPIEGDVSSVKITSGKAYVVVKGKDVPVDSITDVTDGLRSSQSTISQYTNLIGYKVDGAAYDSTTGDVIGVTGTIKALQKGTYEDYAVMDDVNVEISEIVTETPSADPNFMKNYLTNKQGQQVDVVITDRKTGKKVPVTATLVSGSVVWNGDKASTKLNDLHVPVESISNVRPAEQQVSNEERLLNQILEKLTPPAQEPAE